AATPQAPQPVAPQTSLPPSPVDTAATNAQPSAASGTPTAPTAAVWVPPAGATLEDPNLLELANRLHDPMLDQLKRDLGGVLALSKTLRATRSLETRFEVKARDRENFVAGIGAVRTDLAALSHPTDPSVAALIVAVNHRLEDIAPYHFQLNIPTVES